MVTTIPNTISPERFEEMAARVLKMNTGIEDFVYNEMIHHMDAYDPVTGIRISSFEPSPGYQCKNVELLSLDGIKFNCEMILPDNGSRGAILYVHGAAFMRRVNDINLKTANRLCEMTNHLVAIPDYRVGKDYTYDQMVGDIIVSYQYLLRDLGCAPEDIAILADSSGCVSALQAIRELPSFDLPAPGKIILWSPQSDENLTDDKIARAKSMDLSCRTNNLFLIGRPIYNVNMKGGKSRQDIYPLHGDFAHLRSSSVLIQSGGKEIFTEDAYELYSLFSKTCACSLEVYEEMFHNFQTYYSLCDMAKICWEKAAHFITHIA